MKNMKSSYDKFLQTTSGVGPVRPGGTRGGKGPRSRRVRGRMMWTSPSRNKPNYAPRGEGLGGGESRP